MKNIKLAVIAAFALAFIAFGLVTVSDPVKGQSGGTSLSAPTRMSATDNLYNNKIGIHWDTIRGAAIYRILRNTVNDTATASDVGTTAANYFFDATAVADQTYFYWVRAENGAAVSDHSSPDQGTRTGTQQPGLDAPLDVPPAPEGNPVTAAKAYLGKTLFWDEQMSSTRTVSCGTCHHSATGGTDPRSGSSPNTSTNPGLDNVFGTPDDIRGSAGVPVNNADGTYTFSAQYGLRAQVTGRTSLSYVNAAYPTSLFWDGRATGVFRDPITNNIVIDGGAALESQVLGPPASSVEMAHGGRNWNEVAARMAGSKPLALSPSVPTALSTWINGRSYPELFEEVFGTNEVSPTRIALAIATFERTLFSDQTPLDLANAGIAPLTAQEERGRALFETSNCNVCHSGPLMTDDLFHYIGVRPANEDTGRFQVTGDAQNIGEFRTTGLRNVALRGTFLHNGQIRTLAQVVDFYNRGGDFDAPNKRHDLIRPLGLTPAERADLTSFMQRPMTDPRVAAETGPFERPTLYTESNRVPQITGAGRVGSGDVEPRIVAISPPILGNPNFTVSLAGGLGNAQAVLVIDAVDPGLATSMPMTGSFARVAVNTQNTGAGNGWASLNLSIPNDPALIGKILFARWYVYDPMAASGFSVTPAARFTVFGEASSPTSAAYVDFDGDGKTDISVFRPAEGNWYILKSSDNSFVAQNFGIATDQIAPGDYDGDGKTDITVYRDGIWYVSRSSDGDFSIINFGLAGDIPQPGDYDGDGITDVAVYRPSAGTWYSQNSRDGFAAVQFGIASDKAVASDFDGDGKFDPAVFREGTWYVLNSGGGVTTLQYGLVDDKPVVGDYDGDGKSDIAVWRPSNGTWYRRLSSNGTDLIVHYGAAGDLPSPGDYDGDGTNDVTVYRPSGGIWYSENSTSGQSIVQFGISSDRPVPGYIVP